MLEYSLFKKVHHLVILTNVLLVLIFHYLLGVFALKHQICITTQLL